MTYVKLKIKVEYESDLTVSQVRLNKSFKLSNRN
jgi:hypothetical protein